MILHVISGLGIGGAETMLVQVATSLHARGVPQHVVSLTGRGEMAAGLEAGGVAVSFLDLRTLYQAPSALYRLCRIVGAQRPAAIQGWMYHGNLVAAFAHRLAPGYARRRLYWGLRASDMDGTRYGLINKICARLSSMPDAVIANSHAGAAVHSGFGYRPRRLEVIANGVDTARYRPDAERRRRLRAALGLAPDSVVAIHVARVDPMKDHPTFLAAMKKTPEVVGLLVGAGTLALSLPANVRALGARRDLESLYPAADIVVSSSAFGEGFSNALAEGMSAGLTPISTDVGDARLIVGDAGQIVPRGDVDAIAAAIEAYRNVSPDERARRGAHARARIQENFAIEAAVGAFARLYATPAS